MPASALPSATPNGASPRSVSRRVGYAVGVLVNLILIALLNGWPGWRAMPFLTGETSQLILPISIALIIGALANFANLVLDRAWLRAVGEIITSTVAFIVVLRIWDVFPFAFTDVDVPWELIVRVVLGFALAGCVISIIVQLVVLVRLGVASSDPGRARFVPDSR